jgi:hypothetical protein
MNWVASSLVAPLQTLATIILDQILKPFNLRRQDTAVYLACPVFSPKLGNNVCSPDCKHLDRNRDTILPHVAQ